MLTRQQLVLLAVSALLAVTLPSATTQATQVEGGRALLQLGGDSKGVGNLLDNCSGYTAEQKLNFLAGVIGDRKLLQLNKICAGLQCLEKAITKKLSGSGTTADQVTQTVVNYCDNQLDGSGTATVGEVYDAAVKLFPTLATLDEAITADLSPLCEGKVGK